MEPVSKFAFEGVMLGLHSGYVGVGCGHYGEISGGFVFRRGWRLRASFLKFTASLILP